MDGADSDCGMPGRLESTPMKIAALALNGFTVIVVNVSIYRARALYIERNAELDPRPPTISRAISDPFIGEPFSLWITASAICLALGVAIQALHHARIARMVTAPGKPFRIASHVFPLAMTALQAVSAVGMHTLSAYRFPFANEMHMAGSYAFFVAQTAVVVVYTAFNIALLADRPSLDELAARRLISPPWLRVRCAAGACSVALALIYGVLFIAKDFYGWDVWPALYRTYTLVEPAVISSFLALLALMHAEFLLRRR